MKDNRHLLTSYNRPDLIEELRKEEFDVLVVGGGITGAGIALDAASRGLSVALVEKQDFAQGTSSRSTKLIHGGLRYLKQYHFKMVRDVGRERAVVYLNAPHLVVPEKMLLPLIEGGTFGKSGTSIGLWLYDFLAGVHGEDKRKMLSKEKTLELEPLLDKETLIAGGLYAEYRVDDARLTIENIKTAASFGAIAANYVRLDSFLKKNGKISGGGCTDVISGEHFEIKAKFVVNAAGPWVDDLRSLDQEPKGKTLHLTKGVHLVVPYEKLPVHQSVYFDIPDGRMLFAIPRGKTTYIGTTDTNYNGDKENPSVTKTDVSYILDSVNKTFPSVHLLEADVISSWAGLRPLIHEEGKPPSELSRKDEIFVSDASLISIAGGKLTAYRLMAKKVVDLIRTLMWKEYKLSVNRCRTDAISLIGGDFKVVDQVNYFISRIRSYLKYHHIDLDNAEYLVRLYGKQAEWIVRGLEQMSGENDEEKLLLSELNFCIENESIHHLVDFFERRTARLNFNPSSVRQYYKLVANVMEEKLHWSKVKKNKEIEQMEYRLSQITEFI